MGAWLQTQRIEQDQEKFIVDSAIHGKLKINYRVQVPRRTMKALGFDDMESLHQMLEEVATPAVAPHMGGFVEEMMNRKSAAALYEALSTYYRKRYKGANPVTLFKGRIEKGRVKMEVHWLRVGKVFMIPAYQIFNGGLNVQLYISIQAMKGFPADTARTQATYDRRDWAITVKGSEPSYATLKARNIKEYVAALGVVPALKALPPARTTRKKAA